MTSIEKTDLPLSTLLLRNPRVMLRRELFRQLKGGVRPGCFRLDQPYNLYLSRAQAETYLKLMEDAKYSATLHDPVRELLTSNASSILRKVHQPIALIDLGPGYPDKTFPFFDYAKRNHLDCCYVPVDINLKFLAIAVSAANNWGLPVHPMNCLFEELASELTNGSVSLNKHSKVLIMGLTFMNYRPSAIIRVLRSLLTKDDVLIVATQLLSPRSVNVLMDPYRSSGAEALNAQILNLLGVHGKVFNYFVRFRRSRIEMGFTAKREVTIARNLRFAKGTELLTAISYRYTVQQFTAALRKLSREVRVYRSHSDAIGICRYVKPHARSSK